MSNEMHPRGGAAFLGLESRKQSDLVLRRLFDASPDAVVVIDEDGRIVLVNLQTEALFGYARAELIGQDVELLIPERFQSAHQRHRSSFVAAPKVRPMGSGLELFGRKRDGTEFPIEISLSPLPTDEGMLASANIRDVTDRKISELAIRRIQEHLLSAVESIPGASAIFDSQDRLVLCNSMYRSILGQDLEGGVEGRSFEELLDANLKAGVFEPESTPAAFRAQYLAYHHAPAGVIDVKTCDGRNLRIVERRTTEGGTVTTIWDVTDDVKHEQELRQARAQAESASAAKSEFLASMSHELRTPLHAILGFAQLLQRDKKTPLSEKHQERIEHVLKGGDHLLHLIDEVLDLSRIEAGHVSISLEAVSIAEVLAEVKATLDPMALRAEVELVVRQPDTGLSEVTADRTRLGQILMNLGSNALKYGRKRGKAILSASRHDDVVRISVVDDGIGIPEDQQNRIFQPFHRAGQETGPIEGSGIGLAISKRLSELMSGRMGFHSSEGQGSEFWIELPAHQVQEEPKAMTQKPRTGNSPLTDRDGPRYLIVYVEDNPSNIAFMQDLLSDFDRVELVTSPTAEIGIEIIRVRQPHVVIMDINLPGMSGFEATRRLREWPETRGIPIIALSAAAMIRDASRVKDAGFYRYLTKPVKVDELASVLEELLTDDAPSAAE